MERTENAILHFVAYAFYLPFLVYMSKSLTNVTLYILISAWLVFASVIAATSFIHMFYPKTWERFNKTSTVVLLINLVLSTALVIGLKSMKAFPFIFIVLTFLVIMGNLNFKDHLIIEKREGSKEK